MLNEFKRQIQLKVICILTTFVSAPASFTLELYEPTRTVEVWLSALAAH